jgi:type IX secretion system PorP/SprF family membrane protein
MKKITHNRFLLLRILVASSVLSFTCFGFAQQQSGYFHSAINPYLINPAFVGESGGQNFFLIGRNDFINMPYAPKFYHLTFDAALSNPRIGFGAKAFSNTKFAVKNLGFSASYRYKFQIAERHFLSTALSAGFIQNSLDFSKIIANDPSEISDFMGVESSMRPNFHVGFLYQFSQLKIGFSAHNVLSSTFVYEKSVNEQSLAYRLLQQYHISASYKHRFANRWAVDMKILSGSTHGLPLWGTFGATFHYDNMFWIGGGYGYQSKSYFIAGMRLAEQMTLSYSYGISTNAGKNYRKHLGATHEIGLGYRIGRATNQRNDRRFSDEITQLQFIVEHQGEEIDRLKQQRFELKEKMAQFQLSQNTIDSLKRAIIQVEAPIVFDQQPEEKHEEKTQFEDAINEPEFKNRFYVVIGASRSIADVKEFQRLVLKNFDIDTKVLDPNPPFRSYFFVYTDIFSSVEEAQNAVRELEKTNLVDYIIGNIWIHQSIGGLTGEKN